jgi:hypothetical protein
MPGFQYGQPATDPSGDVVIPNGSTNVSLPPGRYRDIIVSPQATLTLTGGGVYHVRDIWFKSNSRLNVSGPSDIRVLGGFMADNRTVIGPSPTTPGVTARDIVFYVGTTDEQSRFSEAVDISPFSSVQANIYARNGTILLRQGTQARGAFIGKKVLVENETVVTLESAFNGVLPLFAGGMAKPGTGASLKVEVPTDFGLDQNYPNPFNPTTQIRYGLPVQSVVRLTVHNVLGQEVARLVDGRQEAGYHEVRWNGMDANGIPVASGVYLYRMQAGDFVKTSKMVLMK